MEAKDFRGLEAAYKAIYVTEAESAGQELAKREKDDDAFGSPNKKKSPRFKVGPEDKKAGTEAWKRYKAGNPNYGLRDDVEWSDEDLIVEKKKDKDTPLQVAAVIDKDRAKKATDDATYDREHGENEKADEDERYSKWERYKMKRDAQRSGHPWKHAKGSTTEKEGKPSEKTKHVRDPQYNSYEPKGGVIAEKDLDAAERRALPDKDFALPGKGKGPEGKQAGSYPIPDKSHARMALAMVAKHGTPEEKAKVRAAVEKKFPGIKVSEEVQQLVNSERFSQEEILRLISD